jgi:hypothetical protein
MSLAAAELDPYDNDHRGLYLRMTQILRRKKSVKPLSSIDTTCAVNISPCC